MISICSTYVLENILNKVTKLKEKLSYVIIEYIDYRKLTLEMKQLGIEQL